jgi:NAD(P)-dependent dehydrogenase (short-subunit alcohol dehydrogenase family)
MAALLNKTALVTGASRGIGRATASALAAAGAHVLVRYGRSAQDAESLVADIRSNMIWGNALGRSLSPSSNSSWCICFTDPCGSRRNPSADKRTLRHGTSKFAPVAR